MKIEKLIEEVLDDASASNWFKWALRSALSRDALDAANDAELLSMILTTRAHEILNEQSEIIAEYECVPL